MSDRKSIDWELVKIHPGPYDLFVHLDRWFKDNIPLARLYHGVPKMSLPYWERMRTRQQRLDAKNKSKWRQQAQKRLLALGLAVRGLADRLWEVDHDSWLLRNCRPSGGEWKGSSFSSGPTGKSCRCRACPWCWLRVYAFLREFIAGTGMVAHPLQHYAVHGLGLGQEVGCRIYQSLDTGIMNDGRLKLFKDTVDKDFRKSIDLDDTKVCKLFAPVFSVEEGWTVRISYIYRKGRIMGYSRMMGIQTVIFDKLPIDKALGKCYPYAVEFLNDSLDPRVVRNLLHGLSDTRSFTTVG